MDLDLDIRPITYTSVDADGFQTVQFQSPGPGGTLASHGCPVLLPYGFFARPLDNEPNPDGSVDAGAAAQGLVVWLGGEPHVMPLADPRVAANLPNLNKGDVGLATNAGVFFKVSADGSLSRFTTDDGTMKGQTIYDRVSSKGYKFVSPYGFLDFDQTGYHLTVGKATFDMGSMFGLPEPAGALGLETYADITAEQITLNGAIVTLGGEDATPVAMAIALSNFLTAFLTPLAAVGPATPVTGGAVTAALTAALLAAANPLVLNEPLYQLLASNNVFVT